MNSAMFLAFWLCTPIYCDASDESIAVVDLRECWKHAPTQASDIERLMRAVPETDAEVKRRFEALQEAESRAKRENSTELERVSARFLKLEFDTFRRDEQDRLRKAEMEMDAKWLRQVNAAVKIVSQRDKFTVVLYIADDSVDTELAVPTPQQILTRNHAAYVHIQKRTNITEAVIEEMSTDEFLDTVEQQSQESEQNRDREDPYGFPPPTPPGVRVRTGRFISSQ